MTPISLPRPTLSTLAARAAILSNQAQARWTLVDRFAAARIADAVRPDTD